MYLMLNNTVLTNFVLEVLIQNKLVESNNTVILTGSSSLECVKENPNYDKYFNGESDIDVLIIIEKNLSFMKDIFSEHLLDLFSRDKINVLNYNYQYGKGRNAVNIKYLKKETFDKWTSFSKVNFTSYRKNPLSCKKPFMKCYGFNDYIIIPYKEEKVSDYYILHYNLELDTEYYLIDIHSMLLFGTIIYGKDLLSSLSNFNFFFASLLKFKDEQLFNLFGYYLYEKQSIKPSELRNFIKKFTEIKVEDIINILKEKGIVHEVKGNVKKNGQLATICWARSAPKPIFDFMNQISMYISHKQFIILVDDMCPKILYARSDDEQQKINHEYLDAFPECKIYFSSDIFKEILSQDFMSTFVDMMKKISLNYYIDFLPEKKRIEMSHVNLSEFIHTFCELFLMIYGEKYLGIDTMIFGKFSQNIIFMTKQQVNKDSKLSYIIIPHLTGEKDKNLI